MKKNKKKHCPALLSECSLDKEPSRYCTVYNCSHNQEWREIMTKLKEEQERILQGPDETGR